MSRDISASKFRGIRVIVAQSKLDKGEKKILLLDIVGTWEALIITFRKILAIVDIIVKNRAFFMI